MAQKLEGRAEHLRELVRLTGELTGRPLLDGNQVTPLAGAENAYPAMLAAMDGASRSITLSTYIFNNDPTGHKFAEALSRAHQRGVEVRVLIDDIGSRYTFPSIVPTLRRAGLEVACFLPALVPVWSAYSNLRSHRKILVIDGCIGFTGGMNIRESAASKRSAAIKDLHFRLDGPVVAHLQHVFADDWLFTTKESLAGDAWFPPLGERPGVGPRRERRPGRGF